jgi:hypothetical protein
MLEVALRNRVHTVMGEKHGPDWIVQEALLLGDHQPGQVREAVKGLLDDGKDATPNRIVAALTLGFWTAVVGRVYENAWQQGLHRVARREDGRGFARKDLAAPLMRIRNLRNRIAHHEPIIYSDLHKTHEQMLQLITWLSPPAAEWCRTHGRFPRVCPAGLHLEIKDASRRRPE